MRAITVIAIASTLLINGCLEVWLGDSFRGSGDATTSTFTVPSEAWEFCVKTEDAAGTAISVAIHDADTDDMMIEAALAPGLTEDCFDVLGEGTYYFVVRSDYTAWKVTAQP